MIGSSQPKVLAEFYEKVFGKKPDMAEEDWGGWSVGSSDVQGQAKEPARVIFNFETAEIKEEFERIKNTGAKVIKELYEMEGAPGMWIATFADPDGNFFQLMTPWKPAT